jgi:tetratricopeptide (TPR) repeat protein
VVPEVQKKKYPNLIHERESEMTKAKKIIKKKLKEPDEFITLTERTYFFITRHSKSIAIGGIIVLILILSAFFIQRWGEKNEENAYQLFNLAMETYQMVSTPYREGSPQEYKGLLDKFNEVSTKFPKTKFGKLSVLYEGNIHLRLGEFEEAVNSYETFLRKTGKESFYRSMAMEGLGYSYEGRKEYEKAVNAFQKVIDLGERFQLGNAYWGMGRCYEKLGKSKEAIENYKLFLKVSPKSQMTNIILQKISNLEK